MATDHPFQHLFETLGRVPAAHAESVNRQAVEVLTDILAVPIEKSGRCILLRAPRAGHGKTHLLSRIQHQMGATHEFIPLHSGAGCRIDSASVIDDALRRLVRQLPASGGLCVLDLVARRLFASSLQPLVASGEVPCQDREGALTALRARPVETFDFHHPNAVTAHWARENFEVLGQRLALELAQRSGLPVAEIGFWVDVLFQFAASPLENSNRLRVLAENVHAGEGDKIERLEALLGLLTLLMRVVLVADDLEGFSADETAALRLAAFLGSLRQSVDRLDVILSINLDIWQSAFVPRLSGGLADRLSEVVVELEPLKEAEMAALLDSRVPGLGSRVLERIDIGSSGQHARGLIRAAGMAWLKATAMDSTPSPVVAPVMEPQPVTPALVPAVPPAFTAPSGIAPQISPTQVAPPPPAVQSALAAFEEASTSVPFSAPSPAPQAEESATAPVESGSPADVFGAAPAYTAAPPAASQPEEFHHVDEAPPAPVTEPADWPAPRFSPAAPPVVAGSPFFPDSPFSTITPEVSADIFSQPGEPVPPVAQPFQAPVDSPFSTAPQTFSSEPFAPFSSTAPPPMQEPQVATVWTPPAAEPLPPAEPYYPPVQSPFQVASPEPAPPAEPVYAPHQALPETPIQPAAEPLGAAPEIEIPSTPAQATPPPQSPADTDRVDDLLRQFRERYGRGSL